jgi:cytochrome c peroxidase
MKARRLLNYLFLLPLLAVVLIGWHLLARAEQADPPEVMIGERLFLETRFAQAHHDRPGKADKVMDSTVTMQGAIPGPFAGRTMNCRACHMVDEHAKRPGAGMRSYADFARLSPVPAREDGHVSAVRNAQVMVNISIPRKAGVVFHHDGEFASLEDLVRGTLTGRNFGWLPGEGKTALAHIARVIRDDDGQGELAREFGGAYNKVLKATDKDIPVGLRLPEAYRIDVNRASDEQILNAVARLIAVYVEQLNFSRDEQQVYNGSPYDAFLKKNNLPGQPMSGESALAYSQRLLRAVRALPAPKFVGDKDGKFETHQQPFRFGTEELAGMQLFFTTEAGRAKDGVGNCIACHAAPDFSDFRFHNTGVSQKHYDGVHGSGAFARLAIPTQAQRLLNPVKYLPASEYHPRAREPFRSLPAKGSPGRVDLGLWNVFGNPEMPGPQATLRAMLCNLSGSKLTSEACSVSVLLPLTVARFKTPVLRDLGHSAPYMHHGGFERLEEVVRFYVESAELARQGKLRNPAPELAGIRLRERDVRQLVAFLESLNEDYD